MNAEMMQRMIEQGLLPKSPEPTFFQHPTGYELTAPTTAYNTLPVNSNTREIKGLDAKLEPSA